jgi:hypothetical protein
MVAGGGFEPPKLSRQIYSLIPLAARESRLIYINYAGILPATADFECAKRSANTPQLKKRPHILFVALLKVNKLPIKQWLPQ